MSLGKLLAAGKSVIGGNGAIAYRENKRACLPKFGTQKNPFVPAPPPETPKPAAKTQKMAALSVTSVLPKDRTSWAGKLNPMTLLRSSAEVPRPVVQAELSLDSVKVVHNDLTDAEVEVVPVKSRPAPDLAISDLQPVKQSWEVLGERLFGVRMT